MIISLMNKRTITSIALPNKVRGQYSVCNGDNVKVDIEGIGEKWFLKSSKHVKILDKQKNSIGSCELREMAMYQLDVVNASEKSLIFVEPSTNDRAQFEKYQIKNDISISIGRENNNDISIDSNYVSGKHARLILKDGVWAIKDLDSSNGTYVNGNKIKECRLKYGDIIYIIGTMIIVGKQLIAINNPDQMVHINNQNLIHFLPRIIEGGDNDFDFESVKENIFYRSPRFKRDVEQAVFKIDAPPSSPIGDEIPLILTIGPSMTMGMASMATAIYGIMQGNMMSAITSGCMLLGTVLWPIISKKYEKKRKIKKETLRQEKYRAYLEKIKTLFNEECQKQKEIIIENNVDINECRSRIASVSRNLWERSYGQNDFLKVCIGKGSIPLCADIQFPEKHFAIERDELEKELLALCEKPCMIRDVPITVSLFDNNITGVVGLRENAIHFANGLILQLATLYSYDELKFVFLYDGATDEDKLNYVKWLPHVWNNDKTIRFLVKNTDDIKEISAYLKAEFETRKEMKAEDLDDVKPYYVIFAFSKELSLRADALTNIYESKKNLHFSVITFFDELKNLPKECTNVIELDDNKGKIYNKNDISGKTIEFTPQIYVTENLNIESKLLANIYLDMGESTYKLPKMMTFLEMFHVGKIEHLNVLERWRENDPTKSLEAPVGVDIIGDVLKLDLHEKYHGPHGLVAGMTGSGKSEFIMTYILSLAVNYHPDEVAFVLIDYKGGGMAKAFESLPHTAGIITNLDGAEINRSLISIQSELRRRQAIFAETSKKSGISNIDIYKYQRMYREGTVSEPLQHLFIISDEFAELKTQQPDFMTQLVSTARIGRSLGVHLILATQKPSGVVDDQIWSNAKFKVCLKVQDKADSMDMLKRPEAAELQDTGRFYLQVGYNEIFKIGQSAWSGAPYHPSDNVEQQIDDSIEIIDNVGRVIGSAKMNRKSLMALPKKQIDEITNYLSEIAMQENIHVRQLWLEPIPEMIYVSELREKYNYNSEQYEISPIIGEYDDPRNQRQRLLTLPITKNGNVVVYGMAGSGKTTFITTMIYSMLERYSPKELNLYILDFSSETLTAFAKAPHVGDVVLAYEHEKVTNLIKLLLGQMQTRKKLFSDYGGDIASYNRSVNADTVPAIVVVINNYAAFSELYEDFENEMLSLAREGTKYGIYFVLTATGTNAIRFRMLQNIGQSFVLQLTDETDYAAILGKTEGLTPSKYKGRGLCKIDEIYEFQTAHAFKEENQFAAVRQYCDTLQQKYQMERARSIPVLPEQVDMAFIAPFVHGTALKVPVGVETDSLEISYFDIGKSYISFVQSEGKDYAFFMSIFAHMTANIAGISTTVYDADNALKKYDNITYFTAKKQMAEGIERLFDTVLERHNTIKDMEEEGHEIPQYSMELIFISSLLALKEQLTEEQKEKLSLILEKGSKALNIFIVVAESSKAISSYNFEKWFKVNSSQMDGIWIGSGIADQYYIKLNKTTVGMNEEMPQGYGYVINNGKARKVKLIHDGEVE